MKRLLLILLAGTLAIRSFAADIGGYLFVTFRHEISPMSEQVHFLLSSNGREWEALNDADPILISQLGDKGVRDPFILRSPVNKKFYCIATDLSINLNRNWKRAERAASQSIVVWESEDLVHWSAPRRVKVAPDNAGCAWAPEAVWDEKEKDYMVFWASKTADDGFAKHRIWAAHTKDFTTFGNPFVYIERTNQIIDTSIVHENETYYRFSKDETAKTILMEKSAHLMGEWEEVSTFSLAQLQNYEGPTCFMLQAPKNGKPAKWCLMIDQYRARTGYEAFETDNLAGGNFKKCSSMDFPFIPVRHGTVLALTSDEYNRLNEADRNGKFTVGGKQIDD